MNAEFYLVIQGKKGRYHSRRDLGTVEVRKKKPATNQDEIAVKVSLDIPDALFEKPTLQVSASVPDCADRGPVITTEVADNIAEIIRQQTGMSVRIEAAEDAKV